MQAFFGSLFAHCREPQSRILTNFVELVVQEKCAIHHGAKCYTFVENEVGMITIAEAEKKCREISGSLASIYDEMHFKKIENYVLNVMKDNNVDNNYFILGMKYQVRETVSAIHNI